MINQPTFSGSEPAKMIPARDALGTDQQTALQVLRRVRKRLHTELGRVEQAIGQLEGLCVHDFHPDARIGPYEASVCTRCGAEQLSH